MYDRPDTEATAACCDSGLVGVFGSCGPSLFVVVGRSNNDASTGRFLRGLADLRVFSDCLSLWSDEEEPEQLEAVDRAGDTARKVPGLVSEAMDWSRREGLAGRNC